MGIGSFDILVFVRPMRFSLILKVVYSFVNWKECLFCCVMRNNYTTRVEQPVDLQTHCSCPELVAALSIIVLFLLLSLFLPSSLSHDMVTLVWM